MDFSKNIWVEKYRPQTLDDLALPEHCIENDYVSDSEKKIFLADKKIIKRIVDDPVNIQNMLFFSESPGTGKTSTIELIAKLIGSRSKYINASLFDDKSTIEKEIITFSLYGTGLKASETVPKIIILDEIDGAKAKAFQEPMKSTIEKIAKTTRVALACNDIDAIIEPLQSRTLKIDFNHSNGKYVKEIKEKLVVRLENICKLENIEYDIELIKDLVEANYPDFRSVLDNAQMIAGLTGKLLSPPKKNDVFLYQNVCDALLKGDYNTARAEHLKMQVSKNIYLTLLRYFEKQNIPILLKLSIITIIGSASNTHNEAANKEVNIAYMFSQIAQIVLEHKK